MSRPISLALIILGSLIIASLIWLHFHLMERQHEALFAKAETIHQEVIARLTRPERSAPVRKGRPSAEQAGLCQIVR